MNFISIFTKRKRRQGPFAISQSVIDRERVHTDELVNNTIDALKNIIALHGIPDSQEEKIRKVREDARREIERQKRISPTKERMERLQLEQKYFKMVDIGQAAKHNHSVGTSITMQQAGEIYAAVLTFNVHTLADMDKIKDSKIRDIILARIIDPQTFEKLLQRIWQNQSVIGNKTGVFQRQAVHDLIKKVFLK